MNYDNLLDASGLRCPMPVLKAKKALQAMEAGQVLKVIATDAAAEHDFPAFCEMTGYRLLDINQVGGVWVFFIER